MPAPHKISPDKPAMRVVHIHPDVHRALRIRAAEEDRSIQEMAHFLLCGELNLLNLIEQAEPAHSS